MFMAVVVGAFVVTFAQSVLGAGAIAHKTGAIQITDAGDFVWVVNPDHQSVSRIRTSDQQVDEFPLPSTGENHHPTGLDLTPSGEVWVAARESDRIYILDASDGSVLDNIDLHHGSAPATVVISPDGTLALVALHRANEVALIDVASRSVLEVIGSLPRRPFGMTFTSVPNEVWVTHTMMDGEDSHVTAIDTVGMNVAASFLLKSVNPKEVGHMSGEPDPPATKIPEGGYLLTRGHLGHQPGTTHVWVPVQYQNLHNDIFTPDSSIQSSIHKVDAASRAHISTSGSHRVVLTARFAHNNLSLVGDGWDARVSGPVDVAFDDTGATAYIVHAQSNDVLVVPTSIGLSKPGGASPLVEIPVGDDPRGIAISPVADVAYVTNYLSRDVSVINLTTQTETARINVTPSTPDPVDPTFLLGQKLFNTSVDSRISNNQKVACASCHPNGETDGVAWEFSQFGAGSRKTFPMVGLNLSFAPQSGGLGQLHRSGDRDEVQDFDFTFAGATMGGTGFLTSPNTPLGPPNAGLDSDLDAIATYVLGLDAIERSPYRADDGSLTEAALRGASLFKINDGGALDAGCSTCHPSPNFTDFDFHPVGFIPNPGSENEGPDFNTPSIVGAWDFGPYVQAVSWTDGFSLGGVVRSANTTAHGFDHSLNQTQQRDLEAFLNSIDGDMTSTGIASFDDLDRPRVMAVLPVGLNAVEVIFDETVDPATAGDPTNYVLNDGFDDFFPTTATVNTTWGNRVRLAVDLRYLGCDVTYTLTPGPIEDVAALVRSSGVNNVLDVSDPANMKSFVLDGTITVTFGDTGLETFPGVAEDAGIIPGLVTWSHARWWLYPATNPEMKGFIKFQYRDILMNDCGVTDSADILDARFTHLPNLGHRNTLELRRCLMPWNAPPRDWCSNCSGAVTVRDSSHPSTRWHTSGARALGGSGTNVSEYHPSGNFDLAAVVDTTATVDALHERVEFAGPLVTDAFRFWFDNPQVNNGYAVEIVGTQGNGTEFWGSHQEGGKYGAVLSMTFAIQPSSQFNDCNSTGTADLCDISTGASDDLDGNAIPDECECGDCGCVSDMNCVIPADAGAGEPGSDVCQFQECDASACSEFAIRYGDVAPPYGGLVQTADILCGVQGFGSYADCPNADLAGCVVSGVPIQTNDILAIVDAFGGIDPCGCGAPGGPMAASGVVELKQPALFALRQNADLLLVSRTQTSRRSNIVSVDVFGENLTGLRGYDLAIGLAGRDGKIVQPSAMIVDEARRDFVFADLEFVSMTDESGGRVGSVIQSGGHLNSSKQVYLGTFTFEVSGKRLGDFRPMVDSELTNLWTSPTSEIEFFVRNVIR